MKEANVVDSVAVGWCKGSGCGQTCGFLGRRISSAGVGREDIMEEEIFERSLAGGDDCQEIKGRAFQEERQVWTEPLKCEPM